jgi:1-acyl-sn-glycerol-3-phosphate acyltransferase
VGFSRAGYPNHPLIHQFTPSGLRGLAEAREERVSSLFPKEPGARDGKLLPFRKGAFLLAHQASVPIVPIAIAGADQVVPPDSIRLRPGRITVCIGKPIPPQPHETPMALMNQTRQAVEALYLVAAKKTFSGGSEWA